MHRLPIFMGLKNVSVDVAKDLALYWDKAGNTIGVIDSNGHLETSETIWKRPVAVKNFKGLRESLKGNTVPWIIVQEERIVLDFSKLQYNVEWLKAIIKSHELGVCDSEHGLMLYKPEKANGAIWYSKQQWRLKGVCVEALGFSKHKVADLSPNQQNPRTADWRNLYFAE